MTTFPALETERLLLREFGPADVPAVFDIFSRDEVTRYHNVATMKALEEAEKLVEARSGLFARGLGMRWALVLKRGDGAIGSIGYYNLDRANRSVEVGYDLHPDMWHKGIMTEALTAVIDYGFGGDFTYGLNRIEALTYVEHEASRRLLERLHFAEEGIRREYGWWKGGPHDLRCFSLLRRDWPGRAAAGG